MVTIETKLMQYLTKHLLFKSLFGIIILVHEMFVGSVFFESLIYEEGFIGEFTDKLLCYHYKTV